MGEELEIRIRELAREDVARWHELRTALWPDCLDEDNRRDTETMLGDPHQFGVFVSERDGQIDGFVEVRLRNCANGCLTSPVGFLEGLYVVPARRRAGVGARLVAAAETWARARKCTEMASDARVENDASHQAHRAFGYAEVHRVVCFRKDL